MLGRRNERRRGRNGYGLNQCRGRFREVGGNGSSAEVREVRNRFKTIGDGSQDGQARRCHGNLPRHQLIQQKFALVGGTWALNGVCPLHVGRSGGSRDLDRCLLDGLRRLRRLWLHDGHQRGSSVHRGAVGGTGYGTQKGQQDIRGVSGWWGSGGRRVRTAAWDGVERTRGSRSRV